MNVAELKETDLYKSIKWDVVPNILEEISKYIFTSKYARYRADLQRRETWDEAVGRVESMHLNKYPFLDEKDQAEIVRAFDLVREQADVPSMRSMQFGGPAVEAHNARIFNCLAEGTEFVTDQGVKSFRDFIDGDVVQVLSHTGHWRPAVVHSYGENELYPITFTKGKNTFVVEATKDHRWLLRGGKETTNIKLGDIALGSADVFSEFDWDTAPPEERLYWAYGLVYGDGTTVCNAGGQPAYSMIRLCGTESKYAHRFEELGFKTSKPLSCGGDVFAFTGTYLKTAPDPNTDSPALIRAFVRGYLDADGAKSDGRSDNKYLSIQSSQKDHIEFIRTCFPVAGAFIVSETDLTGQVTNYGVRPYTISFRITNKHKNTGGFVPGASYRVTSIGEPRIDETWCLEVEEDASFVLPNGLVTGNCSVRHIDSVRAFAESFYLLLCGCGVGLGLTRKYLNRLPDLVTEEDKTGTVITYVVEDDIEGWADSAEALLNCYFKGNAYSGRRIVFDYSRIRRKGTPLKVGGGKAPGYKPLKAAHSKIKKILDTIIEEDGQIRLKSINAYDILMHLADAVLSGGVRRSATSVIFDKDDEDMLNAKTGEWWKKNPQRGRSNNSVLLLRNNVSLEEFRQIVQRTREWGEPGFVFAEDESTLYNPCFEVGFVPVTDDGVCGVQFCNLSSINGSKVTSPELFYEYAEAASIIGTLQAGYTNFPYLSKTAQHLTEEESLLGVSITAMMDNPQILLDPVIQQTASRIVVETNKLWADKLGINPAARCTVIKPEGTSTLALGSMASGIHPAHSHIMFRRVQANKTDNAFNFFKQYNPHVCEESANSAYKTDEVITFPVVVPETAMVKADLDALAHLDMIKSTQENWVVPGTGASNTKNVHHNVSCTVIVQEHEWDNVIDYLYRNRGFFAAVALLASTGDKDYDQAPNEAIINEEDLQKFKDYIHNWIPVDYTLMKETSDQTSLMAEVSCAGPMGCEVK